MSRREQKHRERVQTADVVLLSFPKSGRTWLRWFLQTYYQRVADVPFDLASPLLPGSAGLPTMAFTEDYFGVYGDEPGDPRLLFREELDARRVIVLLRDPRDIVVSYFHWAAARLNTGRRPYLDVSSLHRFVHSPVYGIARISRYLNALMDYAESRPDECLLLSYERLRESPLDGFSRLAAFVHTPVDDDAFASAFRESEFDQMQRTEIDVSRRGDVAAYQRIGVTDWDGDVNKLKVRRGEVGGFRDELSLWDRARILTSRPVRRALTRMERPLW